MSWNTKNYHEEEDDNDHTFQQRSLEFSKDLEEADKKLSKVDEKITSILKGLSERKAVLRNIGRIESIDD